MPELVVPTEERPSARKYVGYTLVAYALVGGVVTTMLQASPGVGAVAIVAGGAASLAILFVMVQALVEEWFNAAEIREE